MKLFPLRFFSIRDRIFLSHFVQLIKPWTGSLRFCSIQNATQSSILATNFSNMSYRQIFSELARFVTPKISINILSPFLAMVSALRLAQLNFLKLKTIPMSYYTFLKREILLIIRFGNGCSASSLNT